MNIRKLSRREFARALKLGHGSTLLHLKAYGDAKTEDLIVRALLHCDIFDWQIEGPREYWHFTVLAATGRLPFYAEQFFQRLKTHLATGNDRAQHILLCRQFFEAGFAEAQDVAWKMFPALIESNPNRAICGSALVDLAGDAGFKYAAEIISQSPHDIDQWDCSMIYERAERLLDYDDDVEAVERLAREHPAGRNFYNAVKEYKRSRDATPVRRRATSKVTLAGVLAMIERKEYAPTAIRYARFGQALTRDETNEVFRLLIISGDTWEQLCYLRLLENCAQHEMVPAIMQYIISNDKNVSMAAVQALAKVKHCLVRTLAFKFMESRKQREIAIGVDLLENNYVEGDAEAIFAVVKKLTDRDRLHRAGSSVLDICKNHRDAGLEKMAIWFFQNTPESHCREDYLDRLVEWNICPEHLLFEAQWDCDGDIQMKARKIAARRLSS